MGGRDIEYDDKAICDGCGHKGAFDFMGDLYCSACISSDKDGNVVIKPKKESKMPTKKELGNHIKHLESRVAKRREANEKLQETIKNQNTVIEYAKIREEQLLSVIKDLKSQKERCYQARA